MNIEENIKLFQQYQKSNKLEKASEMVDAIAYALKTDGRTVLCANHILEFYLFEYYFKTRDYEAVRYPVHRMYHSLAKKYITNNVSLNLSVKDVADYVHLSPEYFTKLFKKEVGQNIKSYILQVKVEIAKDLLGNPNIPISMVALDLGYSNFSHFTQVFKKLEGITPTDYRKNILGDNSFPSDSES